MKLQQQTGKNGQNLAASVLSGMGIEMLETIGNPYSIIRQLPNGHFEVIFTDVASGDHRGVMPDGSSVLVETKTVLEGNLTYSHMREHQPDRLSLHASFGRAVSLLVWVHGSGVYVMRWHEYGIEDFAPRRSITPDRARVLHDEFAQFMKESVSRKFDLSE